MHKKTQYSNHWRNFLALHGLKGMLIGQGLCILFETPWPASPIAGLILGLWYAWHLALKAPCDLTDWQIQLISNTITPYNADQVEPDSYDLRLGREFTRIHPDGTKETWSSDTTIIHPGECLLAHTLETFNFPKNVKGHLHGKSSWARHSLFVECAGLFDKGFQGTAVLELYNASRSPITLKEGDPIAQMSFHRTLPCSVPYGNKHRKNHYQNQTGAKSSWIPNPLRANKP
jgi:dCTP deaminase